MAAVADRAGEDVVLLELVDEPHPSGDDRYGIYAVEPATRWQRRVAETSLDGIGSTLAQLRAEGQLTADSRVGILDRLERSWLVNPYAKGSA